MDDHELAIMAAKIKAPRSLRRPSVPRARWQQNATTVSCPTETSNSWKEKHAAKVEQQPLEEYAGALQAEH